MSFLAAFNFLVRSIICLTVLKTLFTPAGEPRVKGAVLNKTRAGPIFTNVSRREQHASHSCKKRKKNPRLGCHSVVAQWLSSCRPSSVLITNCAITVLEPACSVRARHSPGEPYPVLPSRNAPGVTQTRLPRETPSSAEPHIHSITATSVSPSSSE